MSFPNEVSSGLYDWIPKYQYNYSHNTIQYSNNKAHLSNNIYLQLQVGMPTCDSVHATTDLVCRIAMFTQNRVEDVKWNTFPIRCDFLIDGVFQTEFRHEAQTGGYPKVNSAGGYYHSAYANSYLLMEPNIHYSLIPYVTISGFPNDGKEHTIAVQLDYAGLSTTFSIQHTFALYQIIPETPTVNTPVYNKETKSLRFYWNADAANTAMQRLSYEFYDEQDRLIGTEYRFVFSKASEYLHERVPDRAAYVLWDLTNISESKHEVTSDTYAFKIKGNTGYVWRKVDGVWKRAIPWRKVDGVWKKIIPWVKINGTWKKSIT